jgi:hypothetical protein
VWWTSFVLLTMLTGLWSLASPPYAGPDEQAHVIRAIALDHGQLTGSKLSPALRELHKNDRKDFLMVQVPAIYSANGSTACFAYERDHTAACLQFSGSTTVVDDATYVARHPPAYYAAVGVASWLHRPGTGVIYIMRFFTVLITSALIATAITAVRRFAAPKVLTVGLVLAITPMVLFMDSIVNPSGPEIAASIAVWVCGFLLISRANERVDGRLVTAVGIAGCVLGLTRQLGPLWLGIIALTILGVSNRAAVKNLARSSWARLWAALVVVSCLAQVAWNVIVKPLDVTRSGREPVHIGMTAIVRITFGATLSRYREMVGVFGWLDTPSPAFTWIPWTALLAFLFFAAVLWATKRDVLVLFALLAAVIVVPVVIESATYRDAGGVSWQGRYTLPIAVGIPLLAAFALSSTERRRRLVTSRLLVAIGVTLGIGHTLAFAQNLRRYTVGYDGPIQFWKSPAWTPPLSPLLLTIAYAIAVAAFLWWMVAGIAKSNDARAEPAPSEDERTVETVSPV